MESVILVIHLIVALSIIAVVLVQPSEAGGFLGSSGSMSNLMAPRRSADVLTRVTTVLAGIFFLTSLFLAIIAEHKGATKSSILDLATEPAVPAKMAPAAPDTTKATEAPVTKIVPAPAAAVKAETPKKEKPTAPISK